MSDATRWVFITPRDVWMFRDSKPFSAGQSFVARSLFPPTPQTAQGFLRTSYLDANGIDFGAYGRGALPKVIDAIGYTPRDGQPTMGRLRVSGPFIARSKGDKGPVERIFRAPIDLTAQRAVYNTVITGFGRMTPQEASFQTNAFDGWKPLVNPEGHGLAEGGWLTESDLRRYLSGKLDDFGGLLTDDDLYVVEERPGVALDTSRRTNRDGHFYHAQFIRPHKGVGLLVGSTIEIFPQESGFVTIGGESRFGDYQKLTQSFDPLQTVTSGNLRVVLLTPAYFSGGWEPASHDWSKWVGGGRLVSAALGKPQPISGWDVAHNRPKPLRHYLPAGSVFFFEGAQWQGQAFTDTPDNEPPFDAVGFGQVALGTW